MFRSIHLVVLANLLCLTARAEFDAPTSATIPSISVSGVATIYVVPDRVDIQFGVEVFAAELSAARADHDERVRKVLAAISESGVEAKDMQTTHATVTPEYDREQYGQIRYDQRRGFRVGKSIGVKLRDPSKLDALVNRVMEAGATTIDGITFDHSEIRKHREAARRDAARAARQKAEVLAGELKSKVGRALRVAEEQGPIVHAAGNRYMNMASEAAGGPADGGGGPTFALGQMEVKVTIHATFELTQ